MGKYKSLISNTLIFGIATFSNKLLSFFMKPILTRLLPPEQLGAVDNAISACNLILPIMYLCISEAVIRFGLDKDHKKSDVFTTGILTVLGGYLVFLCLMPILSKWGFIRGYENLVRVFVLASAMRTVTTHFVRAGGLVRIFALDGVFTSAVTVSLTLVFLIPLKMGETGYMLSTICADALSALLLILALRLFRFFKPAGLDRDTAKSMLRYAIPLVPTAAFWWIINLSDRIFITAISGAEANGVYVAALTIPTAITLVSSIFIQAWQISAFTEYGKGKAERFYTNVFRSYYTLVFLAASGLILLIRPITKLMFGELYYEAWKYSLFLILGISFSCFVTFLGTIYNAVKKNAMVTVTTAVGGALNLLLNWLLIPKFGPIGAAAATFSSFLTVFVIRAVDTRKYIRIRMQPIRILLSLVLLLAQLAVSLSEVKAGVFLQCICFAALLFCNLGYALFIAEKLIGMAKGFLARRASGGAL